MVTWPAKAVVIGFFIAMSQVAQALPIGFGYNQGPLEFSEVTSPNFRVYFDARVPNEGAMMLNALEAARPTIERWFGVGRSRPLPIIMSAVSDNASFANFITDALELQTVGQGQRSLVWHEYIHQAMYRTLDNFLGPAGNIVNLPWMPAWYIEGLADTLAVSVSSDVLAGIERYQALTGDWPSYARLHSLYTISGFALRGYATSAAFMRYILIKVGPNRLGDFLVAFKRASMPWWWPYSIVPFADSLPMDRVLKEFTGLNGEDLYEEYKEKARLHWEKAPGTPAFATDRSPRNDISYVSGIRSRGGHLTGLVRREDHLALVTVDFDIKTGWAQGERTFKKFPEKRVGGAHTFLGPIGVFVRYEKDDLDKGLGDKSLIVLDSGQDTLEIARQGTVYSPFFSQKYLYWMEQELSNSRICRVPRHKISKKKLASLTGDIECPWSETMPRQMHLLGLKYLPSKSESIPQEAVADELVFSVSEEHLTGSLHQVKKLYPETGEVEPMGGPTMSQPLTITWTGETMWGLFATRNTRTIRQLNNSGGCVSESFFKDHLLDIQGSGSDALALQIYVPFASPWRKVPIKSFSSGPCSVALGPLSPIEAALARGPETDLAAALKDADLWQVSKDNPASDRASLVASPTLDQSGTPPTTPSVKPANWRGRPIFLFPWIGAEDAFGPQLGIVSIPLMDDLQNETLRVTLLYGLESRFPYQDITLISNRFTPTLSLSLYRLQTYNGRFIYQESQRVVSSFLEEAGGRTDANWALRSPIGFANASLGLKIAYLKPYIGPQRNGRGFLVEPTASISLAQNLSQRMTLTESIGARVAPPWHTHVFDYNHISASTNLAMSLPLSSVFSVGLEGSRTRGKKMRDLKELYLPLKTFIPGSGGGYNRNSFPLTNGVGGLFSPRFGDTQARARANWTVPVIRNVEKLFWIIYGERLDFTAFYNYGGAWNGGSTGVPAQGWSRLIGAHGYSLDLQMENKGVRFNIGLGTGQVVRQPWEAYLTTGFDAVF